MGLSDCLAFSIATFTASTSAPSSTNRVFQPYASYLLRTFSLKASLVSPSKQISLESYKTTSLFSFCTAAKLAASEATPSIISPSPQIT